MGDNGCTLYTGRYLAPPSLETKNNQGPSLALLRQFAFLSAFLELSQGSVGYRQDYPR